MATLNLDQIKEALAGNAVAFRSVTEYQPAGGPGDKANRDIPRRHRVRATAYPTGHAPPWGGGTLGTGAGEPCAGSVPGFVPAFAPLSIYSISILIIIIIDGTKAYGFQQRVYTYAGGRGRRRMYGRGRMYGRETLWWCAVPGL